MMTLFGFGRTFGLCDGSPFVIKTHAYLRMAKFDYNRKNGTQNLRRAPKKKLPYLDDNGTVIADSSFIIEYLKTTYPNQNIDAWLNAEQKAQARLIGKALDEHLYWALVYSRWVPDDIWPASRTQLFGRLPAPFSWVLPWVLRGQVKKRLMAQGTGFHSYDDILDMAERVLADLSTLLGDKTYFFGEQPSSLDATAYGFLAPLTLSNSHSLLIERAQKYTKLKEFCERIRDEYFDGKA